MTRGPRSARRLAVLSSALALAAVAAGCGNRPRPVIPNAAFFTRHDHREAIEGSDTTSARLAWPECVGARTPAALDSLRATVSSLVLAPAGRRTTPSRNIPALLDGFIAAWNAEMKATRRHVFWRFDRRVEVIADTLGVVSFARADFEFTGGAHPLRRVRLAMVHADSGWTMRFDDLFRAGTRDSVSAALAPLFRAARGLTPDTSLAAAGFTFPDSVFRVNDNFAITTHGVRWHFDPYEIAPYAFGATDFTAPFDVVRPFARVGGPLRAKPGR